MRRWAGRAAQRLTALTLATKGRSCALAIPDVCIGTATTADHIIPRARGGADTLANLQPACLPCNQHKGAQLPAESADLTFFQTDRSVREGVLPGFLSGSGQNRPDSQVEPQKKPSNERDSAR